LAQDKNAFTQYPWAFSGIFASKHAWIKRGACSNSDYSIKRRPGEGWDPSGLQASDSQQRLIPRFAGMTSNISVHSESLG
jgi:hypothetical protein